MTLFGCFSIKYIEVPGLKFLSWILNMIFSWIWGDSVPYWLTNWAAIIVMGLLGYFLFLMILKKFFCIKATTLSKVLPEKAKNILSSIAHMLILLFIAHSIFSYVSGVAECDVDIEGIPNPVELQAQIDGWIKGANQWLSQGIVHNVLRFVILPLAVFVILFMIFKEISLFEGWIDVVIALTMTGIFSFSGSLDAVADVILSNVVNLMGLGVVVISIWNSWSLTRVYEHHFFENQWRKTKKYFHVMFYGIMSILYGLVGMFLGFVFLDGNWEAGTWVGVVLGFLLSFFVWLEFYKIPYQTRKILYEKREEINKEIVEIGEKEQEEGSISGKESYLKFREVLEDRKRTIQVRIDQVEDRIRKIEEH